MSFVGLDLGSSSLKVFEVKPDGSKLKIITAVEYANPFGIALPADEGQLQQIGVMIKKVFTDHKIDASSVRIAIPEAEISTKIISTPSLSDSELASAIDWLAEQHIAVPLEELQVEYEVLYRPSADKKEENMRVMIIGVPKKLIALYMKLFSFMEIDPVVMETQVLSMMRTLVMEEMPTTLLVHMGAATTEFVIMHEKEIVFVYSFANGGRLLTRAVERGLSLDSQQAEEYKKSYGVDPALLEGKMTAILDPVLRLFVTEIQKAMQYFTGQFGTLSIKRIVFSGGGALLPGVVPYFAGQFSQEIIVANPFERFTSDVSTKLPADRAASFIIAAGLVMRPGE